MRDHKSLPTEILEIFSARDVSEIDFDAKLCDLGLDSLTGAELMQLLNDSYGVTVKMTELREVKNV